MKDEKIHGKKYHVIIPSFECSFDVVGTQATQYPVMELKQPITGLWDNERKINSRIGLGRLMHVYCVMSDTGVVCFLLHLLNHLWIYKVLCVCQMSI